MNWSSSINHAARKHLGLSMNEYVIADFIHRMSGTKSRIPGWCYASRPTIAKTFDLSRRTVLNILQRLEEKGVIEVGAETHYLRSTMLWYNVVEANMFPAEVREEEGGADFARGVKKVHGGGEKSSRGGVKILHVGGEKSSPNRVIDNISIDKLSDTHTIARENSDFEYSKKRQLSLNASPDDHTAKGCAGDQSLNIENDSFAYPEHGPEYTQFCKLYKIDHTKTNGPLQNAWRKAFGEWDAILEHLPRYLAATEGNKRYRKGPVSYLENCEWINNPNPISRSDKKVKKEKVLKSEDGLAAFGLR